MIPRQRIPHMAVQRGLFSARSNPCVTNQQEGICDVALSVGRQPGSFSSRIFSNAVTSGGRLDSTVCQSMDRLTPKYS